MGTGWVLLLHTALVNMCGLKYYKNVWFLLTPRPHLYDILYYSFSCACIYLDVK